METPHPHVAWWARMQSAICVEALRPVYAKYPFADRNILKLPPEKRWRLGKRAGKYTTGTCGHHATWLACGLIGDPEARIAATGANYSGAWPLASDKWDHIKERSSCAVALLGGTFVVPNKEKDAEGNIVTKRYTCRGYADLFEYLPGCHMRDVPAVLAGKYGLCIVEMGSHIEVAIAVHADAGLRNPLTGDIMAGVWQDSSDGGGRPHTFRPWGDEPGEAIHLWLLPEGACVPGALDWRVEVEP